LIINETLTPTFFLLKGICLNDYNRIFVAGGNLVYHEYKIFNSIDKKSKSKLLHNKNESPSSKNDKNLKDFVSLSEDKDSLKDGEEILSKELYEYDNIHDTWIRRANMLFAKANFTLCAMDDKIYSFGGITKNQDQFDIVECYDLNENKWQYECSMPAPFVAGCVVRHEDAFYVMGGRSGVGEKKIYVLFISSLI
jgi:N-acetylneuraminic acid mutarotase